jgi:hypothetical protein
VDVTGKRADTIGGDSAASGESGVGFGGTLLGGTMRTRQKSERWNDEVGG